MEGIMLLIISNLMKIGIGALLFLIAYLSNMGLGAWKSVKIHGYDFDLKLIGESIVKYIVLVLSVAGLCIVVTVAPEYANYVGMAIPDEYIEVVSNVVIIGTFITGICIYVKDGFDKLKEIIIKK